MKKDGKYRFTLQFPAVTDEQIAVGELLESMGNRKSALIVDAVLHFVQTQQQDQPQAIAFKQPHSPRVSRETLKSIVRELLSEEPLAQASDTQAPLPSADPPNAPQGSELETMLNNLSLFQSRPPA